MPLRRSAFSIIVGPASLLAGLLPLAAHAQLPSPDPLQPAISMGLPPHLSWYVGGAAVTDGLGGDVDGGGYGLVGVRHELIRPVVGVFGVAAEAYGGAVRGKFDGGGRLFASIRALLVQAGLDFRSRDVWPPAVAITIEDPVRRGGLLGRGGTLRFEWTITDRIGLGATLPVFNRRAGQTRPREVGVRPVTPVARIPATPPEDSATVALLTDLHESASWIDYLTTPFVESALLTDREWVADLRQRIAFMGRTDSEFPHGHIYPAEVDAYHRRLEALVAHALGAKPPDSQATAITSLARRSLLDEFVLPADRDFGQVRRPPVFDALLSRVARRVADSLAVRPSLTSVQREAVGSAIAGWLVVVGDVTREAAARWHDSRLVWIPFQFALRPEDHDTQEEVDALLERLVGQPLQPGNDFTYLINESFRPELIRTINTARDYHVLWIHDFPGTTPQGDPDPVSARVVAEGYLAALTRRVQEFDSTGTLPVFMIFLDQWYFDIHHGRRWADLLHDPLGDDFHPERGAIESESAVVTAQRALRDAVAHSRRLQALAAERGAKWLRDFVRVQVSITFPPDPSFRRRLSAPELSMRIADDYMRDHRKVVFYDLTERDPARGAAIFTGEGVGEEYEGARWEDRTLLVRGPAAIRLKAEARALLLSQGFRDGEIPPPLRPERFPDDYQQRVDALARVWPTRLAQAYNQVGLGPKEASALKAGLYNLMPAGSRILAPDSQWSSFFWAGMLVGTALRGGMVFVIAPRSENAPYGDAEVQTILTHDVLEGYIQIRELMQEAFAASGGGLWVGLYGQDISTRSMGDRYRAVIDGMLQPGFPRAAFPFSPEIYRQLASVETLERLLAPTRGLVDPGPPPGTPQAPRLHLKSQLFASGDGLERVLRDPGWFRVFVRYVQNRAEEYATSPELAATGRMYPGLLEPVDSSLFRAPPAERAHDVFYLLTGSQNQNDRSLLLDGEILCLMAGKESLVTLIDFVAIAARSTWVTTIPELDALIPRLPRGTVVTARALRSLF